MGGTAAHGNALPQPPGAAILTLRPTTPKPDKSVTFYNLMLQKLTPWLGFRFLQSLFIRRRIMKFLVNVAQPLVRHVGIYLRRRHIHMTQQFLHTAQIRTVR